jgi:hypothetical protein
MGHVIIGPEWKLIERRYFMFDSKTVTVQVIMAQNWGRGWAKESQKNTNTQKVTQGKHCNKEGCDVDVDVDGGGGLQWWWPSR